MSRFRVTTVQEAKPKTTSVVVARSQAMTIPTNSHSNGNGAVGKEKEGNVFFPSTPPTGLAQPSDKHPPQLQQPPVKGSNKRLQSVSLDTISSSLDSPDLEVKRIMMLDDSSSVGSLDSYNAQCVSTESLDVAEVVARADCQMSVDSSVESISEKCNNLVLQEPPSRRLSVEGECSGSGGGGGSGTKEKGGRTRKTSWIPANQATIDKLMSIFQNPFSRQSSPHDQHADERRTEGESGHGGHGGGQQRKDNSLGNLFNWAAGSASGGGTKKEATESVATPKEVEVGGELISESLMNEIKENISPEQTITASSVQQQQQQQQQQSGDRKSSPLGGGENMSADAMRVKFKLGSTEDFDDLLRAEDEELMLERPQSSSTVLTSDDSCLSLDVEGGIGQIARDSMVMFNTSDGGGGGGGGGMKTSSPLGPSQAE